MEKQVIINLSLWVVFTYMVRKRGKFFLNFENNNDSMFLYDVLIMIILCLNIYLSLVIMKHYA